MINRALAGAATCGATGLPAGFRAGGVAVPHYPEDLLFERFDRVIRPRSDGVEELHIQPGGAEIEALAGGHDLAGVEDDGGEDWPAGVEGETEGSVMEGFERVARLIAGAFGIDAHVEAHVEGLFHFDEGFAAGVLAFSIDEDAAGAIDHAEEGDAGHFDLGDGLVAAGDAGVGDGDVEECVMIADDDIGLARGEFPAAADGEGAAGEGEEDAHPDAGHAGEGGGLLRVGAEVGEGEEEGEDDEHRDDEEEDDPDGPEGGEEGPGAGGFAGGGGLAGGRRFCILVFACRLIHAAI